MKKKYYVNSQVQLNGDHEVHVQSCAWFPKSENASYIGEYESCHLAVGEARRHYKQVNGCVHCCTACHTQ